MSLFPLSSLPPTSLQNESNSKKINNKDREYTNELHSSDSNIIINIIYII